MSKHPPFTEDEKRQFAEAANPHAWLQTADNLHEQASLLRRYHTKGIITRRDSSGATTWDDTNKATFLLCSFALENAIKAFLVYEHPSWIAEGKLHYDLRSHKLTLLSERSSLIPYRDRDRWVLSAFEQGNESWARYPCGLHAHDIQDEANITDRLWEGYSRVMKGYGNKLVKLLEKRWVGPHGVNDSGRRLCRNSRSCDRSAGFRGPSIADVLAALGRFPRAPVDKAASFVVFSRIMSPRNSQSQTLINALSRVTVVRGLALAAAAQIITVHHSAGFGHV